MLEVKGRVTHHHVVASHFLLALDNPVISIITVATVTETCDFLPLTQRGIEKVRVQILLSVHVLKPDSISTLERLSGKARRLSSSFFQMPYSFVVFHFLASRDYLLLRPSSIVHPLGAKNSTSSYMFEPDS